MGSWNRVGRLAFPSILLLTFLLENKTKYFNCSRRPLPAKEEKTRESIRTKYQKNGFSFCQSNRINSRHSNATYSVIQKNNWQFFNIGLADDTEFHRPIEKSSARGQLGRLVNQPMRNRVAEVAVTQVAFSLTSSEKKGAAKYLISRDPLLDISCRSFGDGAVITNILFASATFLFFRLPLTGQ